MGINTLIATHNTQSHQISLEQNAEVTRGHVGVEEHQTHAQAHRDILDQTSADEDPIARP
jgi:hypothetical protein